MITVLVLDMAFLGRGEEDVEEEVGAVKKEVRQFPPLGSLNRPEVLVPTKQCGVD